MSIEVRNISKTFGAAVALDQINLTIREGELLALLGPSGCGKTTLLRIVAGLEQPDPASEGGVFFNGQDMLHQQVGKRNVGFVFQHYALFRHMTVAQNIGFGLSVRPRKTRPDRQYIRGRVQELLHLIQMQNLEHRYPDQLSGGQRQRVALARALAVEPRVLLLDEPFGALDANIRKELRQWLRRLHDEINVTSVFVTHDQEEALEVSDRVVVMHKGRIEQVGSPEEVYHHPANETVCKFLGDVNLFTGRVGTDGVTLVAPDTEDGGISFSEVYVRPHALRLHTQAPAPPGLRATVERVNPARSIVRVDLRTEWGAPIFAEISHGEHRRLNVVEGKELFVSVEHFDHFTNGAGI